MSRTALVTGASAGFGVAIARRLVADGLRVIATGRRAERLAALKTRLQSSGNLPAMKQWAGRIGGITLAGGVGNESEAQWLTQEMNKALGRRG